MTTISYFDDEKLYHTSDPLLEQFGRPQTWRVWRAQGTTYETTSFCGAPRDAARPICESAAAFFIAASS